MRLLIVILALTLAAPVTAQPSNEEMAALRALFSAGQRDESSNRAALAETQRLLDQSPGDPLLVAYIGSIETLEGRYAWLPWNKVRHVDKGLAHLDQALRAAEHLPAGDHWRAQEVRLMAANTFIALPPLFNTHERGNRLLDGLLADPALQEAPASLRAAIETSAALRSQATGRSESGGRNE